MEHVLFDPGYSSCLNGVLESVEFLYGTFESATMAVRQRKFQFALLYPKIKILLNKNISFYLGCLLWGVYLKNKECSIIDNNPCFGTEYNEDSSLEEINFLIDFIQNQLKKDVKYYMNQNYMPDSKFLPVLETYKEFIKMNLGFIQTKITDEINLPHNLKTPTKEDLDIIKKEIDEAIKIKDLTELFKIYNLIL